MSRLQNTQYVLEGLPELMKLDTGLRKSQIKVLKTYLEADMDKKQTGVFNLATGFGKTRMMSILALAYKRANPDGKVLIVVPSTSLIKDENGDGVVKKFHVYNKKDLKSDSNLDFGTYYGEGVKSTGTEFTVTTYNSLPKYAKKINPKDIGLLLLDEAHHALSEARSETIRQFSNAAQYGMTATPGYDPEKDLKNLLENYIAQVTIEEAIKEGDLADTKNVILVSGTPVDLTKVPKVRGSSGDYDPKEYMKAIARAMNGNSIDSGNEDNWKDVHRRISEQIAEFYRDYEDDEAGKIFGKKCMINCRSQEEARITALSINKIFGKMMAATYVSGNKGTENETVLNSFVGGNLPILCQVGKLSEGFDYPDLDIVFNFPTHSRVREAQLGGRAIRTPSDRKRKKTALIVDIAFTHPDAKNVIQGIHKNGQVLFQDIMGEPIIQKGKGPGGGGRGKGKPTIRLKDFNIISNKQTLFYLSNEAKRIEEEEYVPPIRPGMRTSTDFNVSHDSVGRLLKEAYELGLKFVLNSDTNQEGSLVERVKSGKHECLALHEAPEALEIFIKWATVEKKNSMFLPPLSSDDMYSVTLGKKYGVSIKTVLDYFKKLEGEKFLNPKTGKEEDCIIYKKARGSTPIPVLHPEALHIIEEYYINNWKTSSQKGLITTSGIMEKYGINRTTVLNLFDEIRNQKFLDTQTKEEKSFLVKKKLERGGFADALRPEAIPFFEERFRDRLFVQELQEGMLSIVMVAEKYGCSESTIYNYLKELKGEKFLNPETKKEEDYTTTVRDPKYKKPKPMLALRAEAVPFFEERFRDRLFLQEFQEGMMSIPMFVQKYVISPQIINSLFKELKGEKFLNPQTKREEDYIITVKSKGKGGKPIDVLRSEAINAFKEKLKQKRGGKELQERTTSPTLQTRLKAGSDKGKPKAPPVRKSATPEL
ncbi:MAG: DEAD/DEAH box helicase [Alphaproteobacteria bacterium]|nr:DEAD/DEAH box helicase [Alphaproteobacteria bacterium]